MLMGAARVIRGLLPDEEIKLLVAWADLLKAGPKTPKDVTDEWKKDVRQFLCDLITRRKFSPSYQYVQEIDIPEDLLTDIVDLLVGGWSTGSKWSIKNLMGRDPEKDRAGWRDVMASGKHDLILAELEDWTARRGRTRAYSAYPAITVDMDWCADVGMFLIG